jgi:hypothetical protein
MVENNMRRNRNEKQKPQRRKNQRRAIDIGDLLIETPFFMHYIAGPQTVVRLGLLPNWRRLARNAKNRQSSTIGVGVLFRHTQSFRPPSSALIPSLVVPKNQS